MKKSSSWGRINSRQSRTCQRKCPGSTRTGKGEPGDQTVPKASHQAVPTIQSKLLETWKWEKKTVHSPQFIRIRHSFDHLRGRGSFPYDFTDSLYILDTNPLASHRDGMCAPHSASLFSLLLMSFDIRSSSF